MQNLIIPLNSRKKSDLNTRLVGGKAANLLRLIQFGFRTAPGFIITTTVFNHFIRQTGFPGIPTIKKFNEFLQSFREEKFLRFHFDRQKENLIRKHYEKLGGLVAVRSSMVGEDQASASFAGQLDTFLNIDSTQLMAAVTKCYASMFKPQLYKYIAGRRESFFSDETDIFAMAVIIQRMVKAVFSGIAFTADPICGRHEVIIEASYGTGEKIVAGETNPDRYIVNARGKISELNPVEKERPLLSPEQILHLAKTAEQIARHMGCPQDIEWAWDGTGYIFLQTRPISTLVGKNIYSSRLMADMSPGLVKPLQWSTNVLAMSTNVFGRLFTEVIGKNDVDFTQSIRLIHSRIYANVTFFEKLFLQIGLPDNFFEMISQDERSRWRPPITIKLFYNLFFRFLPFVWRYARINKQMNEFIKKQNNLLDFYRKSSWTNSGIRTKYEHLKELMRLHNKAQWNIIITALNMNIRNSLLKKMVQKHAPAVEPSNLICGLPGLDGLEPNKELNRISQYLRSFDDDLVQLCFEGDDRKIRRQLNFSVRGRQLIDEFDTFMNKFGHLSANITNFTEARWIENPKLIWSSIGSGTLIYKSKNDNNAELTRITKTKEVEQNLNLLQKQVFRRLLTSTITYLILREKISLLLSEDTYQFRLLVLSLARDFVKQGILKEPEDIFYLFYDELKAIIEQGTGSDGIDDKIMQRKRQIKQDQDILPEDTICGDRIVTRHKFKTNKAEFLSGICGSSGFKQGYAYVVNDPGDVDKILHSDDILVVPFTHVGWTPLFSRIGGIIAETGGQLSHTSIVAREYGIPAIVSVRNVMQQIKTGQPLTLDADAGRIYLKHLDKNQGDKL